MIIAANWKMNLNRAAAKSLAQSLRLNRSLTNPSPQRLEVILFPSFLLMDVVASTLKNTPMSLGGQDCHSEASGAFTGDTSADMLLEAGASWVLVGHSERRNFYGESSDLVAKKAERAVATGLQPIICVGETQADREGGIHFETVEKQLRESLCAGLGGFAIAYEPVWAIGTGLTPTPQDITAMHRLIAEVLANIAPDYAQTPILYGGSVSPDNAGAILALNNVGGVLVGGASLNSADFNAILAQAARAA